MIRLFCEGIIFKYMVYYKKKLRYFWIKNLKKNYIVILSNLLINILKYDVYLSEFCNF